MMMTRPKGNREQARKSISDGVRSMIFFLGFRVFSYEIPFSIFCLCFLLRGSFQCWLIVWYTNTSLVYFELENTQATQYILYAISIYVFIFKTFLYVTFKFLWNFHIKNIYICVVVSNNGEKGFKQINLREQYVHNGLVCFDHCTVSHYEIHFESENRKGSSIVCGFTLYLVFDFLLLFSQDLFRPNRQTNSVL